MFTLTAEQKEKIKTWQDSREPRKYAGASGGRWTYEFTPTSLGVIVAVRDGMLDKASIDVSDYESW